LLNKYYNETKDLSDSTRMQNIDINFWLPGDILAKADKMTMANSLELRVPFLDIEVAKIASKLPDELKFKKGTKYLLRETMKGIIPEINRKRKKLGFPVPIKEWLKKDGYLLEKIKENPYIKEYFRIEEIEKINAPRKIYLFLILSIWYNVFIEKTWEKS
jgi:asparagine synthase (glutamine-hydrolysing)